MAGFYEHITTEGERWDQIAERYYDDPFNYEPIINANPHVPILAVLEGGLKLQIPIIEIDNIIADNLLPIWKRRKL